MAEKSDEPVAAPTDAPQVPEQVLTKEPKTKPKTEKTLSELRLGKS